LTPRAPPARQVNVHHAKTELSKLLHVDTWKGRIQMAVDVDAPLTDAELEAWGA